MDQIIVVKKVKDRIHKQGRRASDAFLVALNDHVKRMIDKACQVHNGGKKTLDREIAAYVGM